MDQSPPVQGNPRWILFPVPLQKAWSKNFQMQKSKRESCAVSGIILRIWGRAVYREPTEGRGVQLTYRYVCGRRKFGAEGIVAVLAARGMTEGGTSACLSFSTLSMRLPTYEDRRMEKVRDTGRLPDPVTSLTATSARVLVLPLLTHK